MVDAFPNKYGVRYVKKRKAYQGGDCRTTNQIYVHF